MSSETNRKATDINSRKPVMADPVKIFGEIHKSPEYKPMIQEFKEPSIPPTALVLFSFTLLGVTLYLAFHYWRKSRRRRPIPTLSKLEGYRYSRLNQNEMDVDSAVFYSDPLEEVQSELDQPQTEDNQCKPATLHVKTDSLINISNKSIPTSGRLTTNTTSTYEASSKLLTSLEEVSDEDLLQ